eukprot:TRINITY_DN1364_c0_g1_i5.p4 TRINITY_DN1364_c0_g1~~TRINITY_DN1364_c0_g1_i5.p4  ORF type:complete len:151 (-),score=37.42 TRINITY_DN1364_c0_g1_i5:143-595(-)
MLDHTWIAAHIPHQGSMCLLDKVIEWSESSIICRATSHNDPGNPLRAEGRLGAANGIEYAAQAMAIHGALLANADDQPRQGYLTSVRSVTLNVARLDDLPGELSVQAERLSGDSNNTNIVKKHKQDKTEQEDISLKREKEERETQKKKQK